MNQYDYDLFVIGAGSGGVRAARMSAAYGARVGICEESRVGGTCVIRGCVPKKLLVYAAHFSEDFEDAAGFGWKVGKTEFSWPALIASKDAEISRLEQVYHRLLANAGVELYEQRGILADAHTIDLAGKTVTADRILIATGAHVHLPGDVPGIEHVITSNEALSLPELPASIVIVGGGYVACEFAGIFNGLGSKVTLVYRGDQILRGFDRDIRDCLAQEMQAKGVDIRTGVNVASISTKEGDSVSTLTDGTEVAAQTVMYATGRWPNSAHLGLEACGVDLGHHGAIRVDEYSRSTVDNIFAVGDVTDRIALTPVAIHEGAAFADSVFGGRERPVDHQDVSSAVFSQPPVAVVGLSEAEARTQHRDVVVYESRFRPMKHTLSGRDEMSLMKMVVEGESSRVLGCHMVGADAPEIIQGMAVAIKGGATKDQFDRTIGIHPTAAEEFVTMREPKSGSAS